MSDVTSPTTARPRATTSARSWVSVSTLAVATFLVVTSEMLPVGLLTPMSDDLKISAAAVGSSLTVTGVVSAVTAPLVPRLLGDTNRRAVLTLALMLLAVGNTLTALAGGYALLMAGRVVLGIGMGAVWGMSAAVATRLVAPGDVARGVSLVVGGVAAASVIGVPLGTVIGDALGWRAAFVALAVAAMVNAVALRLALPVLRRPAPARASSLATTRERWLHAGVVTGLVVIALLVTAHFAAYTYIRPILEERAVDAATLAGLLFAYGLCGLVGNFVAGAAAARRPRGTVLALATGITVALAVVALFAADAVTAGAAILMWGLAYGGLSVSGQLWMTRAAPAHVEQVTGLYVGVFTGAIALGALLGGVIADGTSVTVLLWVSASLALVSMIVALVAPMPTRRHRPEMSPT